LDYFDLNMETTSDSNCVPFDMASYARILGSLSTLV